MENYYGWFGKCLLKSARLHESWECHERFGSHHSWPWSEFSKASSAALSLSLHQYHQYHNFTSSTHRSFPKYTFEVYVPQDAQQKITVTSLQDIFMLSVKLISFSRICKCNSSMVKLNGGFLETLQVIGINHNVQMHPLHMQWMLNTWCSRYACSLQAWVLSCVLEFDNMLLMPWHAFNFHASCVHVILVRGHNCTQSCASILLQKGATSWRMILFRTASILLEKMHQVWPH